MNQVIIALKGRKVYWEVNDKIAAWLLQTLVQQLGPAKEYDGE